MNNVNIGEKVAYLRKSNKLTQRELALQADMTHSAISSIENNKVSPSVSSLQKIVNVFSLSLSEFFISEQSIPETAVVVAPEQLVEIGNESVSMKLVSVGRKNQQLGFLIEEYQPGSSTGSKSIKHEGEEAGTVLEGTLELTLGDKIYAIRQGESYLFDTNIPHTFTNKDDVVCKIISAHTPANF